MNSELNLVTTSWPAVRLVDRALRDKRIINMAFWILKTESSTYSFSDLEREKITVWDGVRNYQARNNLRLMNVGDTAMIYHSVGPKEIVGLALVTKPAFKDKTAKEGDWVAVEVKFLSALKKPITLAAIKGDARLKDLSLVKQGRLSVCPVTKMQWQMLMEHAC